MEVEIDRIAERLWSRKVIRGDDEILRLEVFIQGHIWPAREVRADDVKYPITISNRWSVQSRCEDFSPFRVVELCCCP